MISELPLAIIRQFWRNCFVGCLRGDIVFLVSQLINCEVKIVTGIAKSFEGDYLYLNVLTQGSSQ